MKRLFLSLVMLSFFTTQALAQTAAATTTTPTTAATTTGTGVPACDDFLAKYETCLKKNFTGDMLTQMMSAFEQTRMALVQLGQSPMGKDAIVQSCDAAKQAAQQANQAMGCTW